MSVIVLGGGVIGLLTAVECVRAGARVELVDQAAIPSASATSSDLHRVVRALHRGDAPLTLAGARAHEGWLDIQRLLGSRFYHRTGVLTAMEPGDVAVNLALAAAAGVSAQAVSAAELRARYPHIRFAAGTEAVLERTAGAVLADHALRALANWLREQPAVRLRPHSRVVAIDEAGVVRLADGDVLAGDRVVVAAGPWSRELLPLSLSGDLTLYRQTMLSYAPSQAAWAGTPAVLGLGLARDAWLMPPVAGTPARLSAASACRMAARITGRDTPGEWRDHLIGRFTALLAGFDPADVAGAVDGYYLASADGGPLLAATGDGVILAYAACGGMSFKFAPLIARSIADRAVGRPPRPTGLDPIDRPRQFTASSSVGSA
jgi:sarcosine oxidase